MTATQLYDIVGRIGSMFKSYSKWQRVNALGQAAQAARDTTAGHRVYLRAMSMLEVELGILNAENSEVAEGYLENVQDLVGTPVPEEKEQVDSEELLIEEKDG